MSVVSENMTRRQAVETARANARIDGGDWIVYEVESALEINRHVRRRNDAPWLSDDDELLVIELCECGRCTPDRVSCQIANKSNGELAKLFPQSERRAADGHTVIDRLNAFTPEFDASKLKHLDRSEQIARAATPGQWHRGAWQTNESGRPELCLDLRPDYNDTDKDMRVSTELHHDAKRDAWYAKSTVIGGCGCCNSPHGRDVDAEHIVNASPANTLQLIARAKLLARLLELSEQWLVALLNTEGSNPWRLVLTSKTDDTQRIYVSSDFERLINHAWAGAPEGVC